MRVPQVTIQGKVTALTRDSITFTANADSMDKYSMGGGLTTVVFNAPNIKGFALGEKLTIRLSASA